jgi:uncharacterized delta-60 repeat protein
VRNRQTHFGALSAFCIAIVIACVAAPPTAGAKPGDLDFRFGDQGRTMAATAPRVDEELGAGMALASRGRIVVAGGRTVLEYLPNGRLNRNFGDRGRLTLHSPQGVVFRLQAVATDPEGRVLIAGTSRSASATGMSGPPEFVGPPPSWATVTRFLANGKRDIGFGSNGTVDSTLGMPRPVLARDWPASPFEYKAPSVEVTGLTVDPQGRPVLTGSFAEQVTRCYPFYSSSTLDGSYVARLTASGAQDSSFDGSGAIRIAGFNYAGSPASVAGSLIYLTVQHTQCLRVGPKGPTALSAVNMDGHPDAGYGLNGSVALSGIEPLAVAVDRSGEIYVVGPLPSVETNEDPALHIVRISPGGALDHSFGRGGAVHVPERIAASALAVDRRGRILLAGTALADRPNRNGFLLARMEPSGKIDRGFGRGGLVATGLGGASAEPTQVLVDHRDRIVVANIVLSNRRLATGSGVALVRYLNGK